MDDDRLFSERPEWADIAAVEQYEKEELAPIIYTVEYKDASNYFRGIVNKGEKSLRVLELTERMIRLNPAHYTAWQYRYETLLCLLFPSPAISKSDILTHPLISNELSLLDELATRFLKTYQVWHHRRLIVTLTGQWKTELQFVENILAGSEGDAKNYHTWSYRQWILAHFGTSLGQVDVWQGELSFVDLMLSKDLRNNSAWHHRFFVVWGSGLKDGEDDRLQRELTYVKQKISLAPNNPSAWNYFRGIFHNTATPFSSALVFVEPYTRPQPQTQDTDVIIDLDNPLPSESAQLPCVEALEFLADVYEAQAEGSGVHAAVSIWKSLAEEHDTIRKNYWHYRIRNVATSKSQSTSSSG